MASFNQVVIVGHITADPKKFDTGTEKSVCFFSVAVNHQYRDKNKEKVEEVHFFDVVCFGSQADSVLKFTTKGSPVLVDGRLQQHRSENEDGSKKSKVSIAANSVVFLNSTKTSAKADNEQF